MMNQPITVANKKPQFIVTTLLAKRLALISQRSTRFVLLEGPARSSKTALAIQAVHAALLRGADITTGLIASRDMDTLNQNILDAEVIGFMTTHPECTLQRDEIGGYYIHVPTFQGDKKILITGYDNESRWKKVLGGSLDVVFLDEANIANKTFVRETFARQIASNSPLTIFTTNGDNPDNMIYQEFGNYGKPIGMIPASTIALLMEFKKKHWNDDGCDMGTKKGYYYFFFRMQDNPTITLDKYNAAKTLYPKGSYYYQTKILGERAIQGDMIFVDYMSEEKLIVDQLPFRPIRYTVGFDIGATKAYSILTLTAWNNDYSKACFMKIDSFNNQGYEAKRMHLVQFLSTIEEKQRMLIESISIDSAESNFIVDIQSVIKKMFGLTVIPSYKATIKERIDMIIIGYSSGRLTMLPQCRKIYDSYRASRWQEDAIGEIREDLGLELNDVMDSAEYSLTTHMKVFSRGG